MGADFMEEAGRRAEGRPSEANPEPPPPAAERVVLFFVDGLGVGRDDPSENPMALVRGPVLGDFLDAEPAPAPRGGCRARADACLGVEGLPQSATGQTTLFTGVNAAKEIGRHLFGFPNARLRELLMEKSILKAAAGMGLVPRFLNAFRPKFFQQDPREIIGMLSASTVAALASGAPFFGLDDVRAGRCLYQDFTNRLLAEMGFDVPARTPRQAGRILADASAEFDFLLYEYFQTDHAGHGGDMGAAREEIEKLEEFLDSVLAALDLGSTLFMLASDHGNIENLNVRGHTVNPAMTVAWGPGSDSIARGIASIQDVPLAILDVLARRPQRGQVFA